MSVKVDTSYTALCVTTSLCAAYFEIDSSTLARWAKEGCPKERRGKWHVPSVIKWRLAQETEAAEKFDYDISRRKAQLYESQESKNRIDIAERLKLLIPSDEVESVITQVTQLFVDAIESIPTRIDAAPEHLETITRECRAAREDVARGLDDARERFTARRDSSQAAA